ncbi:zinc-binding dehydrogenase [Aneurinibacillus sp. Ricciae_BoGa-3]|uniref:zinc-binding dehydrogenase n=1 Tax=Aneurinibacillus sp. Ricciae_BoGa-3 TaxID=3022697 RepID=UPI002341FB3B|nr:zinc-binding dehydrogenase [Aneurinibacillus sp. Ricciae_BoGa-3]WCK52701.1 zinc-binding dehydrogenase [Aneurinibacillus sp. Ricciae_BoGa-3]
MKAFVHEGAPGLAGTKYTDMPDVAAGPGQVRIRLKTAGLNRRDLRVISLGKESDPAIIIGSDGAGVIEQVGLGVEGFKEGDEVIIFPTLHWLENTPAPPENYEILGSPTHGTFAEAIVISAGQVELKPSYLSWEEAGVLPLSAVTAYRALFTRGQVQPGQRVLITGAGGGVGTYLIQFAKAAGATVCATSRSAQKREQLVKLGANIVVPTEEDWLEVLEGEKVDLVIDSVGAATFHKCLNALKPGGTLVTFGATAGDEIKIDIRSFFYGQLNLLGSTMGSREEFRGMLQFITKHEIRPVIDRYYPLSEAGQALSRLKETQNMGNIGLHIG